MSSYRDSIDYLYGLRKHGVKLGLDKTLRILSLIDNPQNDFYSVHVAGTNGKGSASAMIASILMACGFKVGLFTSPHLISFTERIRINNEEISESDVVKLTEEIKDKIQDSRCKELEPTFFEFVTAMAFLYFSRNKVDWAVIETGMGGRLDATNVIIPKVSVITKVGYDHKEFLGNTLSKIASEKAGIIKHNIPVISSKQLLEAERVILEAAKERSSPLFMYDRDFDGEIKRSGIDGILFNYFDKNNSIKDLYCPLPGRHQLENAAVAIKASLLALKGVGKTLSEEHIRKGIADTRWRGRLEIICKDPLIMIDGAHNPDAAETLANFVRENLEGYKIILIIGIMSDKDAEGILRPILPLMHDVIFTAPKYERAANPYELSKIASLMGHSSKISESLRNAINQAMGICKEFNNDKPLILITGSFYTIGEALEELGERGSFSTLRERI
jgi:dihydrofolate synthase/folylpolyglutamate synthase